MWCWCRLLSQRAQDRYRDNTVKLDFVGFAPYGGCLIGRASRKYWTMWFDGERCFLSLCVSYVCMI